MLNIPSNKAAILVNKKSRIESKSFLTISLINIVRGFAALNDVTSDCGQMFAQACVARKYAVLDNSKGQAESENYCK